MELMTAARLHKFGEPLVIERIPFARPRPHEVRVAVKACNLVPNLNNVMNRYAEWFPYLPLPPLPAVFGLDVSGVVEEVGELVTQIVPGDRVYVNPLRYCGSCHACRIGEPHCCAGAAFQGYFGWGPEAGKTVQAYPSGGMAEYLCAPAASLVKLRENTSFEQGARFGYLGTAYAALKKARAGSGKSLVVTGGTGTLGVPTVLLALAMGVTRIFAVARDKRLLDRLRAVDPSRIQTLSYGEEPLDEWVRKHNEGRGADIFIDALSTGAPPIVTLDGMRALRRGGVGVDIGGMKEPINFDPKWFMSTSLSWIGSTWFTPGDGEEMAAMAAAGTLDLSHLDHVRFSLSQANEALQYLDARDSGGFTNVLVMP
ncbi:MAG TPA: alcohol dehydrogenase catalytic domain-containing protein [Burkholderiaceae bacterium]|nr:alcohol dehydrogenase catalytic domain-containing protein [Burkholderiaceae bacterium]